MGNQKNRHAVRSRAGLEHVENVGGTAPQQSCDNPLISGYTASATKPWPKLKLLGLVTATVIQPRQFEIRNDRCLPHRLDTCAEAVAEDVECLIE